jgi:gamma-glutamylcyclotransferase (GGCT)/AIG2-like uncharacterized protein YtfP
MRRGDLLVLYGTLMRGERSFLRFGLNGRLRFVTHCSFRARLLDLGSYPGIAPGDAIVRGQLFAVRDPSVVRDLDRWEGFNLRRPPRWWLFRRERIDLLRPRGRAWVYFFNGDANGKPEIVSGDWSAWRKAGGDRRHRRGATPRQIP